MRGRRVRTAKRDARFLAALAAGWSVFRACRAAGYARASVYEWRDDDPGFAAAWKEALETGADLLEDVSTERAFGGSDTQLIFQLKARRPEKYAERARREVHHSGRFALRLAPEDEDI